MRRRRWAPGRGLAVGHDGHRRRGDAPPTGDRAVGRLQREGLRDEQVVGAGCHLRRPVAVQVLVARCQPEGHLADQRQRHDGVVTGPLRDVLRQRDLWFVLHRDDDPVAGERQVGAVDPALRGRVGRLAVTAAVHSSCTPTSVALSSTATSTRTTSGASVATTSATCSPQRVN